MRALLLRLEGPLQAWSAQGKLGVRDTEREPTKSGVIGLLGAALGMDRSDDATLMTLAALTMAVRVDRAGSVLRDFHTAGGGSFRGDRKYTVFGNKHCVPTERYYLLDARFMVAMAGPTALIERVASAIQEPRYPLFLGRRSCPPSVPPFVGVVEGDAKSAVFGAPIDVGSDKGSLRVVYEVEPGLGDVRYDVPLSFSQFERRYGRRYVATEWLSRDTQPREVTA